MNIRLKNVDLSVQNIATSLEFYAKVLNLTNTPQSAPPHMVILASEGSSTTLSLHQTGTRGGREVNPGSVELAFECDDLSIAHQTFKDFGYETGTVETFGFGRSFEAKDPDGYLLNIYTLRT